MDVPFSESEDLLVERAVGRDKAAFTALYELHVDRIYRHAFYRVGNQPDAEDITGEVFVRAWKAIPRYKRTGAPFGAWLVAIARNLIIDHYKGRREKLLPLDKAENVCSSEKGPEALAEASFSRIHLRRAIMKLKGEKRRVIQMHFIDGFSYTEIASALKKSEGAVRVIQYRALSDLRGMLTE